ncbi:hypothetical protein NX059_008604 [Plenodomus lindquistii]|nr:hypothetical protein NX059_008604 [Plenodomus lindquistii]
MTRIRSPLRYCHKPFSQCNRSTPPLRSFRTHARPQHNLPQPLHSAFRWSYLWYASILALGVTTGLGARHFAGPLGLPAPGSHEDKLILESLSTDIDNLEIVQSLRSQCYNIATDTSLRSGPGLGGGGGGGRKISAYKDWLEVDLELGKEDEANKGLLGVMSGTRGLGVHRAFWNANAQEMVAVVWIGGGLSGWPGVAHGGAIATVFEEVMARMVSGPEGKVEPAHRPDTLAITYAKPTYSLDFYVIRASFKKSENPESETPPPDPEVEPTKSWLSWLSPSKDLTKKQNPRREPARVIVGTLESVKGDLCVRAKGTFGGER